MKLRKSLSRTSGQPFSCSLEGAWNLWECRWKRDLLCLVSLCFWGRWGWEWDIIGEGPRTCSTQWETMCLRAYSPFSDTVVLNMNSITISSNPSSSGEACGSTCHCSLPPGWNCISTTVHLLLLVLNGGQSNFFESSLNALPIFGRSSQMLDFGVLVQELLNTRVFDFSLVLAVDLVADQYKRELFRLLGSALI